MIFVTVGTHTAGFERLVRAIDEWAARQDEPVMAQIGTTAVEPTHCHWFRFASPAEVEKLMREARIVVTHAGAGSMLEAIDAGASVIVVPRRAAHGEALDDHQIELAAALEASGIVRCVIDLDNLPALLQSDSTHEPLSDAPRMALIEAISRTLAEWARDR